MEAREALRTEIGVRAPSAPDTASELDTASRQSAFLIPQGRSCLKLSHILLKNIFRCVDLK